MAIARVGNEAKFSRAMRPFFRECYRYDLHGNRDHPTFTLDETAAKARELLMELPHK
ncbi:MAG: hypothetical protein JF606_23340 [Burkholderiales bacterium]|nr:hypothetical protein [Burkholderiales bacterium]